MFPDKNDLVMYDPTLAIVGDVVYWLDISGEVSIKGQIEEIAICGSPCIRWDIGGGLWPYFGNFKAVWKAHGHKVLCYPRPTSLSRAMAVFLIRGNSTLIDKVLEDV